MTTTLKVSQARKHRERGRSRRRGGSAREQDPASRDDSQGKIAVSQPILSFRARRPPVSLARLLCLAIAAPFLPSSPCPRRPLAAQTSSIPNRPRPRQIKPPPQNAHPTTQSIFLHPYQVESLDNTRQKCTHARHPTLLPLFVSLSLCSVPNSVSPVSPSL